MFRKLNLQHKNSKLFGVGLLIVAFLFGSNYMLNTRVEADGNIDIWWPTNQAKISNTQAFKVLYKDKALNEYLMTWSVDGGQQNTMYDSQTDYPHKEAVVNIAEWTWHGGGPYKVTFRAADMQGIVLGEKTVEIYTPDAPLGPTEIKTGGVVSDVVTTLVTGGVAQVHASGEIENWWPVQGATMSGTQPFKGLVKNMAVDAYEMYWKVDGDVENLMYNSQADAPHKEAEVDLSAWKPGAHTVTFVAKQNGSVIASKDITVNINASNKTSTSNATPTPAPTVQAQVEITNVQKTVSSAPVAIATAMPQVSGSGLSGVKFYVNPNSNARRQATEWRTSRPADAVQMDKIASSPEAIWLGGWNSDVEGDVRAKIRDAASQGATPVFIAYNIPNRDCGHYSAGGVSGRDAYLAWIKKIAAGLGGNKALVVLEPDALALTDCLSSTQRAERFAMIKDAVGILNRAGGIVYIDAGHPEWTDPKDMADRLRQSGVAEARGFAVNVSNFYTTESNISYGSAVAGNLGGKHFIIDTARNGLGPTPDKQWCNPQGRALGLRATTDTGHPLVDAYMWLKNPGESDGNCNGGPSAGTWWPEYALELARRSAF